MIRGLWPLAFLATTAVSAAPPNIVLIVGDDMGYADVGVHGCKDIPTPHLDALARSGTRFTNGYVTGPYCSPTRAGLLTGRYQQRFGHEFNPGAQSEDAGLPVTETTLADRLKAAGYRAGMVGKSHLGMSPRFHPLKRGFDEYFGFLAGAHDYFRPEGLLRGAEPAGDQGYFTDAFAREAVSFIERAKGRPFLLYLAFNAVHTPMQADDARLAKFSGIADERRRAYAAMMTAMDDAVGLVRKKLADEGLERDTLVFFLSDNGGPTMKGTTVNGSRNAPFRGSKRTTLEGGIRVPFFVSWPAKVPAGAVYDPPVIQLDVAATALAAAGVARDDRLEGVDLLPHLTGADRKNPHDALYWRLGPQMAVRKGDWKLVKYDQATEEATGTSPERLYNLADDLGESKDLAATRPDKVRELRDDWTRWDAKNVAPLWGGGRRAQRAGVGR